MIALKGTTLVQDIALNLNQQDGWELESVKKAAKTRAEKAKGVGPAKNEAGE